MYHTRYDDDSDWENQRMTSGGLQLLHTIRWDILLARVSKIADASSHIFPYLLTVCG